MVEIIAWLHITKFQAVAIANMGLDQEVRPIQLLVLVLVTHHGAV